MNLELIASTLRNSKRFTAVFVLNFCLGIGGIFALDYFKGAMNASLERQAKNFLGADLVVASRFPITDADRQRIRAHIPVTAAVAPGLSMSSMASSARRSRLVQVVQVERGFPFYGGFRFADGERYPQDGMPPPASDAVWAYPEILTQLGLQAGDDVRVGGTAFRVARIVEEDAFKAIRFSDYVPRIYMSAAAIERAGLLRYGATARYSINVRFREAFTNDRLEAIENELEDAIGESIHARSPNDGSERVSRMLQLVADFLSLVSLVSLFLSLVGLFYLYSGFLLKHRPDMQILRELGMRRGRVMAIYLSHFFVLILTATALVFALTLALGPWFESIIAGQVGPGVAIRSDPTFFLRGLGFLLLVTPAIAWPMLAQALDDVRGVTLRRLLAYVPLLALLLALAAYVAGDAAVGLAFCAAVAGLVALSLGAGMGLLRWLDRPGLGGSIAVALARKSLSRKPAFTLSVGVALFFATALFALVPQLSFSVVETLKLAAHDKPRLFLIDVQPRQLDDVRLLVADHGASLQNVAPIVRARVVAFNDVAFAELDPQAPPPEDESLRELRDRSVNLSYRDHLYPSEEIVAGRPFSGRYDHEDFAQPVELSVEQRYAERRDLSVGDRLTFDVMGVDVPAEVVNVRTVKWTDFLPNFFLLLQGGALDEAPGTYLATVPRGAYDVDALILALADRVPNVSVVDVKYVIASIVELVETSTAVLLRMGALSMAIGLLIIAIVIHHQLTLRRADILRLKMIGVRLRQIRRSFLIEFAAIAVVATVLGLSVSLAGAWAVSRYVFDEPWAVHRSFLAVMAVGVPALVVAIVAVFGAVVTARKEATLYTPD